MSGAVLDHAIAGSQSCLDTIVKLEADFTQVPRSETERERLVRQVLRNPEQAPTLVQHAATLTGRDPTEYFERGLDLILDGLQTQLRRRRQRSGRPAAGG